MSGADVVFQLSVRARKDSWTSMTRSAVVMPLRWPADAELRKAVPGLQPERSGHAQLRDSWRRPFRP
jgi:hypothetical protein